MKWREYLLQYLAALVIYGICSFWIRSPGYMDAEYYTLTAIQMVEGRGMTQPILWNYLDDPVGLPHPSYTYWMPGPSLPAAVGMLLFGRADFWAGRIPLILLAALSAPMTGWMGFRMGRSRLTGWLAAGMAVFCGYYAAYAATVDSFFLVMIAAWAILVFLDRLFQNPGDYSGWMWLMSGAAAGWMHLNRADGILWLFLVVFVCLFQIWKNRKSSRSADLICGLLLTVAGYLAVTGFWYYRNFHEFGSPFIRGSSRALWVRSYDELFTFPAEILTPDYWKKAGGMNILSTRANAVGRNLLSMFGVQGLVFLMPLWIAAYIKLRHDRLVRIGISMEVLIFLLMSIVFPFSGSRGGFLHSSAALQPFFWGLAAAGFIATINRVSGKRNWDPERAVRMFAPGLILICGLATFFIFQLLVIGEDPVTTVWDDSQRQAVIAKGLIDRNNIPPYARIMINNPAGFSLVSGRESLVIPYGGPDVTMAAARKFDTKYLLLEKNIVPGLLDMYEHPEQYPQFTVVDRMQEKVLLRVETTEPKSP